MFTEAGLNALGYLVMTREEPEEHGKQLAGSNFILQQENVAYDSAKLVTGRFREYDIPTWEAS